MLNALAESTGLLGHALTAEVSDGRDDLEPNEVGVCESPLHCEAGCRCCDALTDG